MIHKIRHSFVFQMLLVIGMAFFPFTTPCAKGAPKQPATSYQTLYDSAWEHYPDDPDTMIDLLLLAVENTTDSIRIGHAWRSVGVAYYIQTDYDSAVFYNLKALDLFEQFGDLLGRGKALNSIGLNLSSMKNYRTALDYHWQSVKIARELLERQTAPDSIKRVKSMLGHNFINLSVCYEEAPQKDSAVYYTQKAIELFTEMQDTLYMAMAYDRQAQAYYRMGNYEKAWQLSNFVANRFPSLNPFERAFNLMSLAQNALELGKTEASISYATKGFALADSLKATWHLQHFARVLAKAHARQGKYETAYQYLNQYKTYSDSLYNAENEKRINYYMLQQKEHENDRLRQANQLKEEQLKIRNQVTYMYSIGLALLVIFALAQFRYSSKLKKLNNQLKKLNAELLETNATKDKFLSIIAHDLKSPLNSIAGFIHLLKIQVGKLSEVEMQEFIDQMAVTTHRTKTLLENLLEWSRFKTGNMAFRPDNLHLRTLLYESSELLMKAAEEKNICVEIEAPDDLVVYADQNMVSSIIRNLLSNAIKFTRRGGNIVISAQQQEGLAAISVKDDGVGMHPEIAKKIFDTAVKTSMPGTENEKGTGLGLPLSKEFAEKNGGSLTVHSKERQGSTFVITLPTPF